MILVNHCCLDSLPICHSFTQTKPQPYFPLPKASVGFNPLLNYKASKIISAINGQGRVCELFDLHQQQIPYEVAWSWQKDIVKEKKAQIETDGDCTDTLIILQHPPVYTLGSASSQDNLNFDIKNPPFDIHRTERGGEVTYHGPGQLVMYPIINLRKYEMDLHWYLRSLEEVVIRVLSSTFAIEASRLDGLTGVWVGNQKLAALGIRVSHWITYHGLALNVTTDLTPFNWIVPCGIRDRQVGSIKGLLTELESSDGYGTSLHHLDDASLIDITRQSLTHEFSQVFQLEYNHQTGSVPVLYEEKLNPLTQKNILIY